MTNKSVLLHFEKLKAKNDTIFEQGELDELRKVVLKGETAACSNVPYKAPRGHKNNWGENDWTLLNVICTSHLGSNWFHIVEHHFQAAIASKRFFLFRGAPDIIINEVTAISLCSPTCGVASDSESEEFSLENGRQPNPMQSFNLIGPPDKLGEVFGGLYVLLVSKILKCIQRGNRVKKKFAVSGLLIGKDYGGARCILSVLILRKDYHAWISK